MKYKLNLFMFDGEGESAESGAATEVNTEQAEEEKAERISFDELIKGEYKEDYEKKIKSAMHSRFKAHEETQEVLGKYEKIADILAIKYGTKDPDELFNSLDKDDSIYEEKAYEAGLTLEQYKKIQKMEAENERFRQAKIDQEEEAEVQAIYNGWFHEAEEMKEDFPNFDLDLECENEKFLSLLENGFSVRDAYEACHAKDIVAEMMKKAATVAKMETVDNIASRNKRPIENGARVTPGKETKFDVNTLSDEQIDELIARAKRGEKISF